ncbi:MAG: DUF1847 domain-containing protein [Methanothermobacter sp.]|nr:DUF1847 domain-containing protein [Methanothermobacter sp.]
MKCSLCDEKLCRTGKNCEKNIEKEVMKEYKGENLKISRISSHLESTYYMEKTRLEEIIEFCKLMDYKNLGIAFCIGLEREAKVLDEILSQYFIVHSVCCKVCGIDKSVFRLKKIRKDTREAMCNPIGQAKILNEAGTELNIIVGLCIGHDILFQKYSDAATTTLIVKDRILSHNPAGVIYSSYYLKKLLKKFHK